jgi:hypothetical protein
MDVIQVIDKPPSYGASSMTSKRPIAYTIKVATWSLMLYSQFQSGANFHDVARRKSGKSGGRAIIPTTYRWLYLYAASIANSSTVKGVKFF